MPKLRPNSLPIISQDQCCILLAILLASIIPMGCHAGTPDRLISESGTFEASVVLPQPLSFTMTIPVVAQPGDLHSDVVLRYHRSQGKLTPEQASVLEQARVLGSPANVRLIFYLYNAAVLTANGAPPPPGVQLIDAPNPDRASAQVWFLDNGNSKLQFCAAHGELGNGKDQVLTPAATTQPLQHDWRELNATTWKMFWRLGDSRYRITETFGGRAY